MFLKKIFSVIKRLFGKVWLCRLLYKIVRKIYRICVFLIKRITRKIVRILNTKYKSILELLFTKHKYLNVRELFFQENRDSGFNGYDMVVRYLALEHYYQKNDFGFDIYKKMQDERCGEGQGVLWTERFKALIKSYEEKGYDTASEIVLDRNLYQCDGSHRMALALYHHLDTIPCRILPYSCPVKFDLEWFIEKDFSLESIACIQKKYDEIREPFAETFIGILWCPVQNFFDEIVQKIGLLEKVTGYQDYEFDEWSFEAVVRLLYYADDTPQWKVEKKLEYMKPYTKKIRLVFIRIEKPHFYLWQNKHTSSIRSDRIKKIVRNAYMYRIEPYFFDIIMHMSDYFYQNEITRKIFALADKTNLNDVFNVHEAIKAIEKYNYALVKLDTPSMPKDFPLHWNLHTDIDIVCSNADYHQLVNCILDYMDSHKNEFSTKIIRHYKKGKEIRIRIRINLELESLCIFQFDISWLQENTKNNFITEALKCKVGNGSIYTLSPEYEYMIRLIDVYEYPYKKHHVEYLKIHKDDLNTTLCDTFLDFNWRKLYE